MRKERIKATTMRRRRGAAPWDGRKAGQEARLRSGCFLPSLRTLVAARLGMTMVPRMTVDGDGTADRTTPS
jgi:DNA-binding transcriptional LysR family regulator